jgi:citrate lyase beta subunit
MRRQSPHRPSAADFTDLNAWAASIRAARRLGFKGSGCIHPEVPVLNREFSPTAAGWRQ